ncbi:helix-turn-helix transcriptional regulator [Paenibacillus chitinolyticus]|uniref:helix-turn-helix transcriptional regulator n=1 Tax=Paenibacillus TaxID=44249 RepID=UPI002DBBDB5A|nr:helix-turn-helix transcriptional regulator [Paenibacillus chitinolyticus]MEC0248885.1 helix-turn-helix transcriptional regulator [Paenibacillus chitinolyticus]
MGDLAEAVGVRRNTISDLANNQSLPGLQTAYDIMDTLNQWAADRGIEKRWLIEEIWTR